MEGSERRPRRPIGDGGRRARATAPAGRGKGECRRERRGRVAAGDGVGLDGVGDGGRRGLRIADTHLLGEERKTTKHTGRARAGAETSPRRG